jgi:hypothetical protein
MASLRQPKIIFIKDQEKRGKLPALMEQPQYQFLASSVAQ